MPDTPKNKRTWTTALPAWLLLTASVAAAAEQGYPPPPGPYRVSPPYVSISSLAESATGSDAEVVNTPAAQVLESNAATQNPYDASTLFGTPGGDTHNVAQPAPRPLEPAPAFESPQPAPDFDRELARGNPPPFEPAPPVSDFSVDFSRGNRPPIEPPPPAADFSMDFPGSHQHSPGPQYGGTYPPQAYGREPGPGYGGGYYPPAYPNQGGSFQQGYAEPMWQSMEPAPYGDLPAGYGAYSRYSDAYPQPPALQPNDASRYYAPEEAGYPGHTAPISDGYQERGVSEETVFRPAG